MKVTISKSSAEGIVSVPTSKSMTIRALMCAALAKGESEVVHPLVSEDTEAAVAVLEQIGVKIKKDPDIWRVTGGVFRIPQKELYCGESATTLRFMTAICSLLPGKHRLVGGPSLMKRPVKSLVEALRMLGVKAFTEGRTTPPVIVEGGTLTGDTTVLPGNVSSQFISALLLIAPFTRAEAMHIRLSTPLTSRSYVLMTIWCLKQFGIDVRPFADRFIVRRQRYQPARIEIEGDWSSASYLLALGASCGNIGIDNLDKASLQGDRVILEHLRNMGVDVRASAGIVTAQKSPLRGINADLSDCIDLLPTMAVLAAQANGKSEFTGIERARIKESNRVRAVFENLKRLGIQVTEMEDRLIIIGAKTPVQEETAKEKAQRVNLGIATELDSYGDHRIAMAFGVLGAAWGGITIKGAECVAKTFPTFWETLESVGVKLERNAE